PPGAPLGAPGERASRGGRRARRTRGARRGVRAPPGERLLPPARALARAARPGVRVRIAFMHRRLAGGGTEADLRRMAAGLAARGHEVHVFAARVDAAPPGVTLRRVPVVRAGRLARLLSFAALAPRLVARERWDVVVGFGRTPRQDVVRVGGGTHRSYLARMEAAGLRGRRRGPYHRAILRLETRAFAPGAYRRVLAADGPASRRGGRPPGGGRRLPALAPGSLRQRRPRSLRRGRPGRHHPPRRRRRAAPGPARRPGRRRPGGSGRARPRAGTRP